MIELPRKRSGFTLIELLVVIAIIGILIALLLPAVQAARESARMLKCSTNLKQLGLAVDVFHETYEKYPPARYRDDYPSWLVLILPFLEATGEFDMWDLTKPYYHPANAMARIRPNPMYHCPTRRYVNDMSNAATDGDSDNNNPPYLPGVVGDYGGCAGNDVKQRIGANPSYWQKDANGMIISGSTFGGDSGQSDSSRLWDSEITKRSVSDGLSNTLLAGEKHIRQNRLGKFPDDGSIYNGDNVVNFCRAANDGKEWAPPDRPESGEQRNRFHPLAKGPEHSILDVFGSWHPSACNFVFADGRVQSISTSVNLTILEKLAVRNDSQVIPPEF
jgi:prepilin-type N-terminal cleavage/methylation domain-containing protein/prepilin-type processing-associated H-X9-DG protein